MILQWGLSFLISGMMPDTAQSSTTRHVAVSMRGVVCAGEQHSTLRVVHDDDIGRADGPGACRPETEHVGADPLLVLAAVILRQARLRRCNALQHVVELAF